MDEDGTRQRSSQGREDSSRAERNDSKPKKPSPLSKAWVKIAIAVVVLVLVAAAIIWWLNARNYESTDDAFIDTHIVHISPQIAGQVIRVAVNDNQLVHKGQPLVDISSADADTKLSQVVAQQAQ